VTGDVLAAGERLAIAARLVCAVPVWTYTFSRVATADIQRLRAALAEYEAATRNEGEEGSDGV
jgi:hypothetical protein